MPTECASKPRSRAYLDRGEVDLTDRDPAARTYGRDHPPQRLQARRQVDQKVARVHKVKRGIGQRISQEVMGLHLHAIADERLEQAGVEVGREHRPRSAHALGQQSRRRALTRACSSSSAPSCPSEYPVISTFSTGYATRSTGAAPPSYSFVLRTHREAG